MARGSIGPIGSWTSPSVPGDAAPDANLGADGVCHVCDQAKYIGGFARIPFGPEVIVAPAVDQLDSHLDLAAFPQQAALDQGVYAQFPGDVGRE